MNYNKQYYNIIPLLVLLLLVVSESSLAFIININNSNKNKINNLIIKTNIQNRNQPQKQQQESVSKLQLYNQDGDHGHDHHITTRRDIFSKSCAKLTASLLLTSTATSTIMPQNAKASTVRITKYPPLEYLEPIYELKLSIQALKDGIKTTTTSTTTTPSKRPFIKKRLEKLFSGSIFSERNYLLGLAITYSNQIKYDEENELKTFIKLDKDKRLDYMMSTLKSLEYVLDGLKDVTADGVVKDEESLIRDVEDAERSIGAWFSMVPSEDVDAVDSLFRITRAADANRDGKLDASELATLPEKEREVWLKRVALAGD